MTGTATTVAEERGIRIVQTLVAANLGLVALQAVSAGLFLSGFAAAPRLHAIGAVALQAGAFIQAVAATVLWRRRRVPAAVATASIVLLVMVFLQAGFGFRRLFWLHVPVGVGLFAGLMRQANRLNGAHAGLPQRLEA